MLDEHSLLRKGLGDASVRKSKKPNVIYSSEVNLGGRETRLTGNPLRGNTLIQEAQDDGPKVLYVRGAMLETLSCDNLWLEARKP